MKKRSHSKYIFYALFIIVIIASFNIIKPYITSIISAFLLSFIFYPLYSKINKKVKSENLASALIILLIILIVFLPLTITVITITKQAQNGISFANSLFDQVQSIEPQENSFIASIFNQINGFGFGDGLAQIINKFITFIINQASSMILKVSMFALHFFLILFIIFYLLKQGPKLIDYVLDVLSMEYTHKEVLIKNIKDIIFAVIYGFFLTAVVQGALGALGFFIFGFSDPLFWGIMMMFAAIIPFVGTAIIWVPAVIINAIINIANQDSMAVIYSILFFLYGVFIISGIDNLIKPKIIGDRAKIHPIVILLGVLGGIPTFGIIGIILGPLVLSILITFIKIYNREI